MITSIELRIVSDESLPQWQLAAFVERAEAQGVTANELLSRLIRQEILANEPEIKFADLTKNEVREPEEVKP